MKLKILSLCMGALTLLAIAVLAAADTDDIAAHRECVQCGMDRKAYGFSRMLLVFDDGAQTGVCSLHCAVVTMEKEKQRKVTSLLVADRDSRTMLEASKAFWVIGGDKRGVMTSRAKWAFATAEGADGFIAGHGGVRASFEEALKAATDDMHSGGKKHDMGKKAPAPPEK